MPRPDSLPAWQNLKNLAAGASFNTLEAFAANPGRADAMTRTAAGLLLDYSKHPVSEEILTELFQLARQSGLDDWIERLFSGEKVNQSEGRAALHMALRADTDTVFPGQDCNVMPEVKAGLQEMSAFVDAVRNGEWKGSTGKEIRDVVNIGIGGSDLGPRMFVKALQPCRQNGPALHFVGNGDGAEIHEVLRLLNPETTLFLVVSKSFTTTETLANAEIARSWASDMEVQKHFVAVSACPDKARAFGIEQVLPFWDWVGGRFSVWSAVGVSIALSLGMPVFRKCLEGARAMDNHFRTAAFEDNLPVILALLGVWHTNFRQVNQHVVLPYTSYLRWLAPYLQQLEMESNGKGVDRDGDPVSYATVPALWGDVGTNAQHAFMQRLHQGPEDVPVDFILPLKVDHPYQDDHDSLVANCFAQAEALMKGRSAEELKLQGKSDINQRVLPGNRPSSMLLMPALSPESLGALVAMYEHKVFVQAVIWHINPFDQWGVEEGKRLAGRLLEEISNENAGAHDASTVALMEQYLAVRSKADSDN